VTGAKHVLTGKWGFYRVYFDEGEYDLAPLVDSLGKRFETTSLSMKAYPCCHYAHVAIDGALAAAAEMRFCADNVASVPVEVPHVAHDYLGGPFRIGDSPQVSAQFSIAHNVAAALLYGRMGLTELEPAAIQNERLLALADCVATVSSGDPDPYGPATIHVTLHSGRTGIHRTSKLPTGHPTNPMTDAQRQSKVRECLTHAGWRPDRADELIAWVEDLERSDRAAAGLAALFRAQ
jgi:2-methylcitrate dehydratase PrpD